jgi:hypothetical protein
MGFEKIGNDIYSLTIDREGLDLFCSNHIDEEFTLIGNDKEGFVLDGELHINRVDDLINVITKVMYNKGVRASYSEANNV